MHSTPESEERARRVIEELVRLEEYVRQWPDTLDYNVGSFIRTAISSIKGEIEYLKPRA